MAEIGGTCLNRGCIPTKTLRSSADAVMLAGRLPEYGVETGPAKICLDTIRKRKDSVIGILDLMLKCKLAPSKKEARRLVEQGGVEANGEKGAPDSKSAA